jgi:chromate transporter
MPSRDREPAARAVRLRPVAEVFEAFLRLGLTSFGGPIAHLGYFRRELLERRGWVDEAQYARLIAVCQSLPGPASSQLGFSLGLIRGGWRGGLAAFVGFTAPSAALLFAFAWAMPRLDNAVGRGVVHGLKLGAVAVVAQGLYAMVRRLTPDVTRALIAAAAAVCVVLVRAPATQLAVIAAGAALGALCCRGETIAPGCELPLPHGVRTGFVLLVAFASLLAAASFATGAHLSLWSLAAAFYRSGALVFGGGHVVLPLLRQQVVAPGWVDGSDFMAGYGAAQAVPGPLFSIAAFLGARVHGLESALLASIVALLAIFLPGLLLVAGTLPFVSKGVTGRRAVGALAGVNATVVGLLAAALYDPVWTSAVRTAVDAAAALAGFALLASTRMSVLVVLALCVLTGLIEGM